MRVLVYGWYGKSNIGDELFIDAFRNLFPDFEFIFVNNINENSLEGIDAVFFGGGSFLLAKPLISEAALEIIKTKPIFYIGVGVESEIHPTHIELIKLARLVAIRSLDQVDKVSLFNKNTKWIPDLVYSLQTKVNMSPKINRSVLVLPNISIVPHHLDPYWKHASWSHFKSEFAQFLDILINEGFKLNFMSMCRNNKDNDDWPAGEIIGHMTRRNKYLLDEQPMRIEDVTGLISQYSLIITQRFHGIVLSEIVKTPYIAIHHLSKLKFSHPRNGSFLDYYSSAKQSFIDSFDHTLRMKFSDSLPIESNIFESLSKEVRSLL